MPHLLGRIGILLLERGKSLVEQGDESDSDLDSEDLEMINSGTTQVEIWIMEGSRTITIQ